MKVGHTQKRIMGMLASDFADVSIKSNGEVSFADQCELAYRYVPFFLKEYEGMPKPERILINNIPVESADAEWIADNIGLDEMIDIFEKGCTFNKVQEEQKKN